MTEPSVAQQPPPAPIVALPKSLPVRYPTEPEQLTSFRRDPSDEKAFLKLRKVFRESEDWRALATLLVLHAAAIEDVDGVQAKAADLCIQAYELLLERVKDRDAAAHALARAVQLKPDNVRSQERLRKLYEAQGSYKDLVALLRWRLKTTPNASDAAALHTELADLLEKQFLAVGEAVGHFEQALQLNPTDAAAAGRLIDLYSRAGAWTRAGELLNYVVNREDLDLERNKLAEYHRRLAAIESEHNDNVAAAARHLQAALKAVPDDIAALQAFGVLYLASGKATDDGVTKAADIFYKAAELARRREDQSRALKLLRRCLHLMPDHQQASAALENTLLEAEDWVALDELYREWLFHFSGAEAVPMLLRRADLLDKRLNRREEARQLFEEASRFQRPSEESWVRLEQIYEESSDYYALAGLLDAQAERMPEDVPTQTLLRAARVYREELGLEERAAVYYYKVLEREPFDAVAFEGYKEHWRRKHNWVHLRDLILYQIEQAIAHEGDNSPLSDESFAEEFVELAEICERRLGDIDGALETWTRLEQAYPNDPRPGKNIGRIEKRARMWDNMVRVQEAELERAVDPAKRLDVLKRLTQVYRDRQNNPDRAIELYHQILELSPNDVQATRALTALYDRAGDYGQVVEMLREQYERSKSNTERISLLRRMAELWHNELDQPDDAIWACEQILQHTAADRDALYRLHLILEEQERWEELYDALERELSHSSSVDNKVKTLRRMARLAERELADEDRAVKLWSKLLEIKPGNLEIIDRIVGLLDRSGRYDDLKSVLDKAAAAATTPLVRQIDYRLRLGQMAESHLDDTELARSSFEAVVRARPDHRAALEALVRIYRDEDNWRSLAAILGKQQELAETEEDAFRIAWERHEILTDRLEDPSAAAKILEELANTIATGRAEVASSLLDLYERAADWDAVIRQAEHMLLAAESPGQRKELYDTIVGAWLDKKKNKPAALATLSRYVDEFTEDLEGFSKLAGLQLDLDDPEGAIASLQRRLDLAPDTATKTATLGRMADVAEKHRGDGRRALSFLRQALSYDNFAQALVDRIGELGRKHGLWSDLLAVAEERMGYYGATADVRGQMLVALEATDIAQRDLGDPRTAFDWARRGFLAALEEGVRARELAERLESLANEHGLWEEMLVVVETEISVHESRGDDDFDPVERLEFASRIAEERIGSPDRAVGLLQRAHRLRPDDEDLATRLAALAEKHQLWQALIELQGGRLKRAETDLGRFDACTAIARIYETNLDDPEKAFEWLRKAANDLAVSDPRLSKEAFELLSGLTERHGLWPQLVDHHLEHARSQANEGGDGRLRLAALKEAARLFHDKMADPLAAIRTLAAGLEEDLSGESVLQEIRELSEEVDAKRDGDLPAIGALMLLGVLQRLCERADNDIDRIGWIEERATLRQTRLDDPVGAMAERYRLLALDPEAEPVLARMEELADEHDLWHLYAIRTGAALEATEDPDDQIVLYKELSRLFEGPMERPEYALRARLMAWRLNPQLPPREGELDEDNATIWRLAEATGAYTKPPVPRDVSLTPELGLPELRDNRLWETVGIDPKTLEEIPSPYAPKVEVVAPAAVPLVTSAEMSIRVLGDEDPEAEVDITSRFRVEGDAPAAGVEGEHGAPMSLVGAPPPELGARRGTQLGMPLSTPRPAAPPTRTPTGEIEEILEFEELDADEIEMLEEDEEGTVASEAGVPESAAQLRTHMLDVAKPPPPPRALDAGLPALPRLHRPLLPPRPRVGSAWEEVAVMYAEMPAPERSDKAEVALVLARLWNEGAHDTERAFAAHESALVFQPEWDVALQGLRALADAHAEYARLQHAYELLLAQMTVPTNMVAMGLRLAGLLESRDDAASAERVYEEVLGVDPHNAAALTSLCRMYEAQDRRTEYTETFARLLEAEDRSLDDDERIARTLDLVDQLGALNRRKEAVERLELLVRRYPHRSEGHQALIDRLLETRQWQPAIEAMKVASEAVGEDEFRLANLARIAELYDQKLGLPDRAIGALFELVQSRPDEAALARLQELLMDTGRQDEALPVIQQRIELLDDREEPSAEDEPLRLSLLVAKARVLQETGGDEAEAMTTLEQLLEHAPDNDEVAIGLSRMYRRAGRLDEGVALLVERWRSVDPADSARFIPLTLALSRVLDEETHDPRGALDVVGEALHRYPENTELMAERANLARTLHDIRLLADSLASLDDNLDALLEAAHLLRTALGDGARAVRLYSRVLAEAKKDPDNPDNARRLAGSLEGLVRLRVDDGDIQGAMDFMDKQLSEVNGRTIRAQLLTEMGRITYRSTGDLQAARARFSAALQEDSSYARAKLGKAEILIESDNNNEAEKLLLEALESLSIDPEREVEHVEALMLLARAFDATGRAGEAYRRLTSASRIAPDNLAIRAAIARNRLNAGRHRDAVTVAEQVEQQLAEGIEQTPEHLRLVSDIFVTAALSELELKAPEDAVARLVRAAEVDPSNPAAIEPLVGLLQERGRLIEAARYSARLARQTPEKGVRGQRYVEAGMLFHDAASALADSGGDPEVEATEAELRRAAFENLRQGLQLVEESGDMMLERGQLEIAFRASAEHDPQTALRVLDSLLLHTDLPRPRRLDLLLEGVRIGLNSDALEVAERYAEAARGFDPKSPAVVLGQARVLEATDRVEEIEGLVEGYFAGLDDKAKASREDIATRVELLLRLAELQDAHPHKAVAAFEKAAALDPDALEAEDRKQLADLYARADIVGLRVFENLRQLLALEPLYEPALRALANNHAEAGDLDQAHALYEVLRIADPDSAEARAFLEGHELVSEGGGTLDPDAFTVSPPPGAGIPELLQLLWEGGQAILAELLPRIEVPPDARISPVGDSDLALAWHDALKILPQTKVALVDQRMIELDPEDDPDGASGFISVRCQQPPILLARERAWACDDSTMHRFAVGRALYLTTPEGLFATGLRRDRLATLISAALQAFHPRHVRRKHHQKADDPTGKLAQELARKLPMRISRKITQVFKDEADVEFDSPTWRAWIRSSANRVGLVFAGDVAAALAVLTPPDPQTEDEGVGLRQQLQDDAELRDLVAFAGSLTFVEARRELGFTVRKK